MPGLRSLIARRRCSLPVQSIINSQNLDSYSTVVNAVSLNKNSFETFHSTSIKESTNTGIYSDNNISAQSERKWDLHSLFQSNNLSSEDQSSNLQCTNFASNDFLPKNECVIVSEEIDKENISINTAANEENVYNTYVESPCIEPPIDLSHSINSSMETSPERIVIKMKLLHSNSLSEIPKIPADSSEYIAEEAVELESKNSHFTRWMIDSILNEPVVEVVNENKLSFAKDSESPLDSAQLNKIETSTLSATSTFNSDTLECPIVNFVKTSDVDSNSPNLNENSYKPITYEQKEKDFDLESLNKLNITEQNIPQFVDYSTNIHVRRPSESEISEDSLSSDISSNSSNSSIKSCSIVIKRIDNSGTYGCFQSPKSKRKKIINNFHQANDSLCNNSFMNLFSNVEMTSLPCSVILCDVFQNILKSKRCCSFCFNVYDIESCLSVDIGSNIITFQCNKCDWLNIYKLVPRNVQIDPVH